MIPAANRTNEGIATNRMWTIVRLKRQFTRRDLILLADAKKENARSFLKALKQAGIIKPSKPTGRGLFWMLVKDPGPQRPQLGIGRSRLKAQRTGKLADRGTAIEKGGQYGKGKFS